MATSAALATFVIAVLVLVIARPFGDLAAFIALLALPAMTLLFIFVHREFGDYWATASARRWVADREKSAK